MISPERVTGALRNPCRFNVDDVVPADRPIWTESLSESLSKRFKRKVLLLADSEKPVTNALVDSFTPDKRARFCAQAVSRCHPLIDAVISPSASIVH